LEGEEMERLTIEYCDGYAPKELCDIGESGKADDCEICGEYCEAIKSCQECAINQCFKKLAEYEDLEEQGLLLRLPCREGDIVYRICPKCNDKHEGSCKNCAWCGCASNCGCTVYGLWNDGQFPPEKCTIVPYKVSWNYIPNLMEHFGKTVFLTQAEAEDKLKRIEEGGEE